MFVTDIASLVLFVISTDLSCFVVFTELPSAPFERLISVSAADVIDVFTSELMIVPLASSPTLKVISFVEVPSIDTVDLLLISTF